MSVPRRSFTPEYKREAVRLADDRTEIGALFDYIETFYNRRRRHSSLGYLTPDEYERRHHARQSGLLAA